MKTIQVDEAIYQYLVAKASAPGEDPGATLKRLLEGRSIELDDDTYAALLSRSSVIGETPSQILRRTFDLGDPPPDGDGHDGGGQGATTVVFHIPKGTAAAPWNTWDDRVIAHVGDTLRIVNDDAEPHRPHTGGVPFPHPAQDIASGQSLDVVLTAQFGLSPDQYLYDHDHGDAARFYISVSSAG